LSPIFLYILKTFAAPSLAIAYQAGGAPQVAAYAETIERRFPAIPPTDLETRTQAAGDGGATPSDSKAVMAYQAKGPDAVRAARVFSRTYQRLKRNLNGITEDQFLRIQFDTAREGLDVPGDGE
jgi:hypothetical protein